MTAEAIAPNRSGRRRARTRAALLEAARRVFAEHGLHAATIQQITDAADVAKGSFYNHFDSRDAILAAVVGETLEALGAALDRDVEQRETDPARVVAASLLCTLRSCLRDPTLGGFVLANPDVLEIGAGPIGARGRRDLGRGRETGRFAFEDLELVLTALAGGGYGVLRRRMRGGLDATAELRFVALALRMLGLPAPEADAIAAEVNGAATPEVRG